MTRRIPFEKPWLSIDDQIHKLKGYGLVITDETSASQFLQHINYYRVDLTWRRWNEYIRADHYLSEVQKRD